MHLHTISARRTSNLLFAAALNLSIECVVNATPAHGGVTGADIGRLWLAANDSIPVRNFSDNSGSLDVLVTPPRSRLTAA
jgi:hypothetical protein